MDSVQNLQAQQININKAGEPVVVETEEERRRKALEAAAKESELRREAFRADGKYIAQKRAEVMRDSFTTEKAAKHVDEMLKVLDKISKDAGNTMFVSKKDLGLRIQSIMQVYEVEIGIAGTVGKRAVKIREYKEKYERLMNEDMLDDNEKALDKSIESISESMMEKNDDSVDEDADTSVDNTLSAATMMGVREIDRWMLRHMHETGLTENDKFAFVSMMLKRPARERLYMYYVIEKQRRHKPMASDVVESQLSYVPDKDAFVKQMKMSFIRIFRRAANGSIYWDKLSDAYGQLEHVRPAIQKYSKIDQNGTKKGAMRTGDILTAYADAHKGPVNTKKFRELEAAIKVRNKKLDERDVALVAFKDSLVEFKKKKMIADTAWVGKQRKRDAATAAAKSAHKRLQELIDADTIVGAIEQYIKTGDAEDLTEHLKDGNDPVSEDGFDRLEDVTDVGDTVVSQVGYAFSAVHDPIVEYADKLLENDSQFLGLTRSKLAKISVANVSALSVLAVSSLISTISMIKELHDGPAQMGGDIAAATADLISQIASTVESGLSVFNAGQEVATAFEAAAETVENLAEEISEAAGESLSTAETVAGYLGIGTASVALVANSAVMINSGANRSYVTKSESAFEQKRFQELNDRIANEESEEEEKARLRREKYEDSLIKHQRRVLKEEQKSTAIDMFSNASLLGASLTGGIITVLTAGVLSPVLAGVSVGICIFSTIRSSIKARRQKRDAVDDYLGIAEDNCDVLNTAFQSYIKNTVLEGENETLEAKYLGMKDKDKKKFEKLTKSHLRTAIRNEAMAKLGCASKAALFDNIMEKYGDMIYEGAFMDGENLITDPAVLTDPKHLPYVNLIKSLGLKIKVTDAGILPTKEAIVGKLQG